MAYLVYRRSCTIGFQLEMSESNKPTPEQIERFLEEIISKPTTSLDSETTKREEIEDFLDELTLEDTGGVPISKQTEKDIKRQMEEAVEKVRVRMEREVRKVKSRFYPELHRRTGHKKPIELCGCPMANLWREFH